MISYVTTPYIFVQIIALSAFLMLSGFITSRILATAPVLPAHASAETDVVTSQETYAGVIAWVNANEIRITDTFGVTRAIRIDKNTDILISGYPLGVATYANLRMLDHVRVLAIKSGSDVRAETIQVQ